LREHSETFRDTLQALNVPDKKFRAIDVIKLQGIYESMRWAIYQKACWAVAPVEFALTPTRKATPFAVVNLVHCRLSPTQPFSERLPTYKRLPTLQTVAHLMNCL
ncbi:MAG: hypothetical protein LBL62_09845, partial [Planctomycetaceae bacterium]|nr:hypothetical protein [Planctomycetaceae bacterium]